MKIGQAKEGHAIRHRISEAITGLPLEGKMRNTYSYVHGWYTHDPNFQYDKQTRRVMDSVLATNSNCLDIGANEGVFVKEVLKHAPYGQHMAFEPIPELAQGLREKYPKVEVHECALSDAHGASSYQVVINATGYSGLKRRDYDFGEAVIEEITVQTRTLDDVYPSDRPLRFVKIDVEGAELQVLRGGVKTITRHRPYIVFEHGLGAADFYGTRPEQVYDLLNKECRLNISVMRDWLEGGRHLTREEFVGQFENLTNYYFIAHPNGVML